METNRKINDKSFVYLIKISIGPKNFSVLVKNKFKVPISLLETMAKGIITKEINDSYTIGKQWKNITSDNYFNRMMKVSDFEIEDLNELEIYNLELKFDKEGAIMNRSEEEKQKTRDKTESNKENGRFKKRNQSIDGQQKEAEGEIREPNSVS